MRFAIGLRDRLFGEKVVVAVPTPRGVVMRRVTVRWLDSMQETGALPAPALLDSRVHAIAHVLDADRGYRAVTWKIGTDIDETLFRALRDHDSGDLFVVRTSDRGTTRSFGLTRPAWETLRDQPWSPGLPSEPSGRTLSPASGRLPLPLRTALRLAKCHVALIAWWRGTTPEVLINAPPRFTPPRRLFWSRVFTGGAVVGVGLAVMNGWVTLSVAGLAQGALTAVNFAGFAAMLFATVAIAWRVYFGVRIHGRQAPRRIREAAALYRHASETSQQPTMWPLAVISILFLAGLGSLVGWRNVLGLSCFVLVTVIGAALPFITPPTVLFLGASSPQALELLASLRQRVGWRVAALLDTSASLSEPVGTYMNSDNFRSGDTQDWRRIVSRLESICVMSVLDTAISTEHVLFEATELFRRRALGGVVFVGDSQGRYPVLRHLLESGAANPSDMVCFAHRSTLDRTVRSLLRRRLYGGAVPQPAHHATVGDLLLAEHARATQAAFLDCETIRTLSGTIMEFAYPETDRTADTLEEEALEAGRGPQA